MKILHIAKFYPPVPGGIENFLFDLANAQVAQGHTVYVLAHQAGFGRKTRWESLNGVNVGRIRTFGQAAYAPVTPEFPLQLLPLCGRFKPDVIHAHLPNTSVFWLLFAKKKCPWVLHWHSDVVPSALDRKMAALYRLYRPWEKWLLNRADRIITTSTPYLKTSRPLSAFRDKCTGIPLGINPARLPYRRRFAGFREGRRFTVLSVGRFAYYKGFEHLIEAAANVPEADFMVVGGGPRYMAIKKQVSQKGLKRRVHLPGEVDEACLRRLFDECDVFCLPSVERTEAFGLVLLEAMSCGKPLISTSIPGSGVSEVNRHGETGLQVPPADPEALADAVRLLQQNPGIRRQMGEAARRRLVTDFHINSVTDRITSLYNSYIV